MIYSRLLTLVIYNQHIIRSKGVKAMSELEACFKCGGTAYQKTVGDEVYLYCDDCGLIEN